MVILKSYQMHKKDVFLSPALYYARIYKKIAARHLSGLPLRHFRYTIFPAGIYTHAHHPCSAVGGTAVQQQY